MKKIGSFVPNELKIFQLLALSQIPKCLKDDDGEKFYKIYDFKKLKKKNVISISEKGGEIHGFRNLRDSEYKGNFDFLSNYTYKTVFRLSDFFGIENYIGVINKFKEINLLDETISKIFLSLFFSGIIIKGPSKSGKTFLAYIIAGEFNLPIFHLRWLDFLNSFLNKKHKKILKFLENLFKSSPGILFLDNIEQFSKSTGNNFSKNSIEILIELDSYLKHIWNQQKIKIIFLGSSSDNDFINSNPRESQLFSLDITLQKSSLTDRNCAINKLGKIFLMGKHISIEILVEKTFGFTIGHIFELFIFTNKYALMRIISRNKRKKYFYTSLSFISGYRLNTFDFDLSLKKIRFEENIFFKKNSSNVFWTDIGGLENIRRVVSKYIIEPIKKFHKIVRQNQKGFGFLLYGPPGCGKTLIAQAIANESSATFIGVKGPEIFDKFLGESEKTIRSIFSKARANSPTIIFFDEIDSIGAKRSDNGINSQNVANDRVLNQLLTELDGLETNKSIYVIAATNRPDIIDKAILRPGRIDKFLFVPLPNQYERLRILKTILKKLLHLPYYDISLFTHQMCLNFSGADLMGAVRESILDCEEKKINYISIKSSFIGYTPKKSNYIGSKNLFEGCSKINLKKF
jgi:ribosome biogenesis ATPase